MSAVNSQNHLPTPRSSAGFSSQNFLSACWAIATVCATQKHGVHEPEYPGHESGEPTEMAFGIIRFHSRILLLVRSCSEEEDGESEGPLGVEVCANLPCEWPAVRAAVEHEGFDGWTLRWKISELTAADQTDTLSTLLTRCYQPLPGSLLNATKVLEIAAMVPEFQNLEYVDVANGKVRVAAVAGSRTGVATGRFIYDQGLIQILRALRVPYEERLYVVKSSITPKTLEALVDDDQMQEAKSQLERLQRDLANAEKQVDELKAQIARQTRTDGK